MNDKANAAAPTNPTPSELESEFRHGIPSAVTQPHAETVSDYFKRLYPECYVQIITNMNRERGPGATASVLSSNALTRELHCAFIWADSPEGDAFWRCVAQREVQ
jgi:hypothetical protein